MTAIREGDDEYFYARLFCFEDHLKLCKTVLAELPETDGKEGYLHVYYTNRDKKACHRRLSAKLLRMHMRQTEWLLTKLTELKNK